jgi:DNA-binding NtrC family response regulator
MGSFNVLLVDDETDFLNVLIRRVKRRGIDVCSARNAAEALECLETEPVDVVVLDVKMPGMDGVEALKEIKRGYPSIEVIMLSGHASVDVAIEGMELGAFDYLMKPVDIDELCYKLEDAFKRRLIRLAEGKGTGTEAGTEE